MKSLSKSKEARTRGPDLFAPLNRRSVNRNERRLVDLLGEHRLEMLNDAKELSRAGATTFEAAQYWGVTSETVRMWMARDPVFGSCLTFFDDVAIGRVKASLYDRAVGYSYHAEEIKTVDGAVVRVPVIKHEPPSVQAQVFFLKNRDRENWRDEVEGKISGSVDVNTQDVDPRRLAMAIIAALRDAATAPVIEHEQTEEEEA